MDWLLFAIFLATAFGAGMTGAAFPTGPWYRSLNKPTWTPPYWVFPVAWTSIYLLIAFAGARVAGQPGSGYAMAFWAMQIAFNALWTPVFFGLRRLSGALPVMLGLWVSVLGCTITHFSVDFWAGVAFVPYLVWVTVAGFLNLAMVRLNPNVKPLNLSEI